MERTNEYAQKNLTPRFYTAEAVLRGLRGHGDPWAYHRGG